MCIPLFFTRLLNFIFEYKIFLGIGKKKPKEKSGNKVPIKMRISHVYLSINVSIIKVHYNIIILIKTSFLKIR